jgi:pimeloyl-ACP methyl ester carboxylesterase
VERRAFLSKIGALVGAVPAMVRTQETMSKQAGGFDSNGVTIHYLAAGTGEPLILLHGFVFSIGPAWVDGGLFDELSRTNRVVAMDLRGHGASGKPHDPKRYGIEMVRDVLRLMDHLGFDAAHVVGYSLGGTLACKCLELAPERLRSVVLGGAGWMRKGDGAYRSWTPLAEMLDRVRPGEKLSSYFWPNRDTRPPHEIQDLVDRNDPAALAALARGMLEVTVAEDALESNPVPTLAICGEHDPITTTVLAMKGAVPNLSVRVVAGLGHDTLPGSKEFREAVQAFLLANS